MTIRADGNSRAARSARAKAQLRDRFGRWIEMGGGAIFHMRGVPKAVHGTVTGWDAPLGLVHVRLESGQTVSVPSNKMEQPKAIIRTPPKGAPSVPDARRITAPARPEPARPAPAPARGPDPAGPEHQLSPAYDPLLAQITSIGIDADTAQRIDTQLAKLHSQYGMQFRAIWDAKDEDPNAVAFVGTRNGNVVLGLNPRLVMDHEGHREEGESGFAVGYDVEAVITHEYGHFLAAAAPDGWNAGDRARYDQETDHQLVTQFFGGIPYAYKQAREGISQYASSAHGEATAEIFSKYKLGEPDTPPWISFMGKRLDSLFDGTATRPPPAHIQERDRARADPQADDSRLRDGTLGSDQLDKLFDEAEANEFIDEYKFKEQLNAAFGFENHRGYSQEVTSVFADSNQLGEDTSIEYKTSVMKDGEVVGSSKRIIRRDTAGTIRVENDNFIIAEGHQGQGVASHSLKIQKDYLKSQGAEGIFTHANISVGGYAWARAGFGWDPNMAETSEYRTVPDEMLDDAVGAVRAGHVAPEHASEVMAEIQRLRDKFLQNREDPAQWPTPYEISKLGEASPVPGKKSVAKIAMLHSDWYGVLPLQDNAPTGHQAIHNDWSQTYDTGIRLDDVPADVGPDYANHHLDVSAPPELQQQLTEVVDKWYDVQDADGVLLHPESGARMEVPEGGRIYKQPRFEAYYIIDADGELVDAWNAFGRPLQIGLYHHEEARKVPQTWEDVTPEPAPTEPPPNLFPEPPTPSPAPTPEPEPEPAAPEVSAPIVARIPHPLSGEIMEVPEGGKLLKSKNSEMYFVLDADGNVLKGWSSADGDEFPISSYHQSEIARPGVYEDVTPRPEAPTPEAPAPAPVSVPHPISGESMDVPQGGKLLKDKDSELYYVLDADGKVLKGWNSVNGQGILTNNFHQKQVERPGEFKDVTPAPAKADAFRKRAPAPAPVQEEVPSEPTPATEPPPTPRRPWSPDRPVVTGPEAANVPTSWEGLRDWVKSKDKITLDTETTGFNVEDGSDQVIELAATRVRSDGTIDKFSMLVNPGMPIHPAASAVHGITDDMVKDASTPAQVFELFKAWANQSDNNLLVAHNANFDNSAVAGMSPDAPAYLANSTFLDTFRLARAAVPKRDAGGPTSSHGLGALAEAFDVDLGNAHRAGDDAQATSDLLPKILDFATAGQLPPTALIDLPSRNQQFKAAWPEYLEALRAFNNPPTPDAFRKRAPKTNDDTTPTTRGINKATRTDDKRTGQGQTPTNFVNETTGAPMSKTETGDTFEQLFMIQGKALIEERFGKFELVTGAGSGTSRTTPLDLVTASYGAELKTLSKLSPNQKTAIKADEITRKLEAVGTAKLKPLLLVQVVDQEKHTISLHGIEMFGSKAVSRMEHFGTYAYSAADFLLAQQQAGHADKAPARAAKAGVSFGPPAEPAVWWKAHAGPPPPTGITPESVHEDLLERDPTLRLIGYDRNTGNGLAMTPGGRRVIFRRVDGFIMPLDTMDPNAIPSWTKTFEEIQ